MKRRCLLMIVLALLCVMPSPAKKKKFYFGGFDCNCGIQQRGFDSRKLGFGNKRKKGKAAMEVAIAPRIGLGSMVYYTPLGQLKPGINVGLDTDFSLFITTEIGVKAGLNIAYTKNAFAADDFSDAYRVTGAQNMLLNVYYTIGSLHETHAQLMLEVPLQVALRFEPFTVHAGAKFQFPVLNKFVQTLENSDLKCAFPTYGVVVDQSTCLRTGIDGVYETVGSYAAWPKFGVALAVDGMYNVQLKSGHKFSVGVYADYTLTPFKVPQGDNLSLLSITDTHLGIPVERVVVPLMEANHSQTHSQVVPRCGYFDVGVKIAYVFGFGKRRR